MAAGSLIVALHRETLPVARVRALVSHPHLRGLLISSIVLSCVFAVMWLWLFAWLGTTLLHQLWAIRTYLATSCPSNPNTTDCINLMLSDPR
jgi:dolichyl-phosphate-mannose--protein O-mannosyl transferase